MSTVRISIAMMAIFLVSSASASHSHMAAAPLLHRHQELAAKGLDPLTATHMFGKRAAKYPDGWEIPKSSPQAWTDAYNAAKAAGKIPGFAPAVNNKGTPAYPAGSDHKTICSWTNNKCLASDDITEAPANMIGINFDDGPTPASPALYDFLEQNKQGATHFMIGSNVVGMPDLVKRAVAIGGQLAVHTWSHQLMTTLTDAQVVAELGWTMQAIYDVTGLVPYLWRPPQGDVDNRVRAIAKEVFGLRNSLWNQDVNDWCLHAHDSGTECPGEVPGKDYNSVETALQSYLSTSDRSVGLIVLEHELSNGSVTAFKQGYPLVAQKQWTAKTISDVLNIKWYQNTPDGSNPVPQANILPVAGSNVQGSQTSKSVTGSSKTSTSSQGTQTTTDGKDKQQSTGAANVIVGSSMLSLGAIVIFAVTLM